MNAAARLLAIFGLLGGWTSWEVRAAAAPAADPSVLADGGRGLEGIVGHRVEVKAAPILVANPAASAAILEQVRLGILDAEKDSVVHDGLPTLLRSVALEGWVAGDEIHHVVLKSGLLTIQTQLAPDAIGALRSLVALVVKKAAHKNAEDAAKRR